MIGRGGIWGLRSSGRKSGGYILWEILAGLGILAVAGWAASSSSGTGQQNVLASNALSQAEGLLDIVHGLDIGTTVTSTVTLNTEVVTELSSSTIAGLKDLVGCSPLPASGLCGPFPGSAWSVSENATAPPYAFVLSGLTLAQCSTLVEIAATAVSFASVNGLVPGADASFSPSAVQSTCSGGTVTFLSN